MSAEDVDSSTVDDAYGGDSVIACIVVSATFCTAFVALRFIAHRVEGRRISLEDWFIIPAWVMILGLCANSICVVKLGGVGRHESYVLKFEPETMRPWALSLFAGEITYIMLFPFEKTSILLLYLRLFRVQRWFRFTAYIMIAYIWIWSITATFVALFQCNPISYVWDKSISGTCIDQFSYLRWNTVPNVIHDIAMLIMPVPIIWKLQVELRQKLALSCVFVVGSLGCVVSLVRLSLFLHIFQYDSSHYEILYDSTWTSIQLVSWTAAEPSVILVCACLPALWPLIIRLMSGVTKLYSRSSRGGEIPENTRPRQYGSGISTDGGFIPLNDIEAGLATTYSLADASTQSETRVRGVGIRITKEFVWEATENNPTMNNS
ncbi:integral membrane protein [Hypoxylon crocopeplum]|nr:integral membrane protein [Hypoxylon crocopeplum]